MADHYVATGAQNIAASLISVLAIYTTTTIRRAKLYEFVIGADDTPADVAIRWVLRRQTAVGTNTPVVPIAKDPAAPASTFTSGEDHTGEPTYTAATELFDQGLNLRATFRWAAGPEQELWMPALASNGLGMAVSHGSNTAVVRCTKSWYE